MDPNQKTVMVEGFVAAVAKAARVSNVPKKRSRATRASPATVFGG